MELEFHVRSRVRTANIAWAEQPWTGQSHTSCHEAKKKNHCQGQRPAQHCWRMHVYLQGLTYQQQHVKSCQREQDHYNLLIQQNLHRMQDFQHAQRMGAATQIPQPDLSPCDCGVHDLSHKQKAQVRGQAAYYAHS